MKRKTFLLLIFLVLVIAYFGWLHTMGLRAEEPRRAIVSFEMMKSGNYLVPRLLGWDYYNKPPLFNWVMILFFKIFGGINEWIVRLPSTLSLFIIALVNWRIARKYVSSEVAALSSLFLLTSADILYYGSVNTGELDFFFTMLVYLNMMVIFTSMQKEKYLRLFALSWFLAALGFLTKGLPAIAFQVITLFAVLIYYKKIRLIFSWKHLAGLLMFLLPVGTYLYLVHLKGDDLTFLFIVFREASQRSAGGSQLIGILASIVTSPLTLIKLMLPWSLFLPLFFIKESRKLIASNPLLIFSLLFILVNIPIYLFSSELRDRYLYPFLPFLSILIASMFLHQYKASPKIKGITDKFFGGIVIISPLIMLIAFFIPQLHMSPMNKLINGLLILAGIVLCYFYLTNRSMRIYAVILLLGLSKIAMNITYLPESIPGSRSAYCQEQVNTMLKITGNNSIELTGTPEIQNFSIKIGDRDFFPSQFTTPIFISYEIPYYYALNTNSSFVYTQHPEVGSYYLVEGSDLPKYPGEVLHHYIDLAIDKDFYLIRFSGP